MKKIISLFILVCFLATGQLGQCPVFAQDFSLPLPGTIVHLSPEFKPPLLKGIKVYPDNPFHFDFILDQGDVQHMSSPNASIGDPELKQEAAKLVKYFLASLTIPEKDLWVNLSPYEKDRIIPNSFGLTEMGRDLLAEDYMLKQITASLIYPEGGIGKRFWKRIYTEAAKKYGTTNIAVNTFNKVWIVPEKAVVYENVQAGTAYVVDSRLKVMLEQDYLSLEKHEGIQSLRARSQGANQLGSQVVREIVIPELTKEVNEGKNFVQLRQVYNSLILAIWYKKKIKDSILAQVYADKNKITGVQYDRHLQLLAGTPFKNDVQGLYQEYLKAFKKGVFNYIREEQDPSSREVVARKYFSGGFSARATDVAMTIQNTIKLTRLLGSALVLSVSLSACNSPSPNTPPAVNPTAASDSRVAVQDAPKGLLPYTPVIPPFQSVEEVAAKNSAVAGEINGLNAFLSQMKAEKEDIVNGGINGKIILRVEAANRDLLGAHLLLKPTQDGDSVGLKPFYVVRRSTIFNAYLVVPLGEKPPDIQQVWNGGAPHFDSTEGENIGDISYLNINTVNVGLYLDGLWFVGRTKENDGFSEALLKKQWPTRKESPSVLRNAAEASTEVHEYEHSRLGDEVAAMLSQIILGQKPFYELKQIWAVRGSADLTHPQAANMVINLLMQQAGMTDLGRFEEYILSEQDSEENLRAIALQAYGDHRHKPFFDKVTSEAARHLGIPLHSLLEIDARISVQSQKNIQRILSEAMKETGVQAPVVKAFVSGNVEDLLKKSGTVLTSKDEDQFMALVQDGNHFSLAWNNLNDQLGAYVKRNYFDPADIKAKQADVEGANALNRQGDATGTQGNQAIHDAAKLFNALHQKLGLPGKMEITSNKDGSMFSKIVFGASGIYSMPNNLTDARTRTGGVDLTFTNRSLQTKVVDSRLYVNGGSSVGDRGNNSSENGNEPGIKFHIDPAMFAEFQNASGFEIGSLKIKSLKSVQEFLGAPSAAIK